MKIAKFTIALLMILVGIVIGLTIGSIHWTGADEPKFILLSFLSVIEIILFYISYLMPSVEEIELEQDDFDYID